MKNINALIGVLITLFSVIGFTYVKHVDMKSLVGLSPGAYPMFLLVIIGLCGVGITITSVKKKINVSPNINYKKVLPLLIVFTIYVYAFKYIGYMISTIIFLIIAMYIFKERRVKLLVSVPIITSVVIYFLFKNLFLIPLP